MGTEESAEKQRYLKWLSEEGKAYRQAEMVKKVGYDCFFDNLAALSPFDNTPPSRYR